MAFVCGYAIISFPFTTTTRIFLSVLGYFDTLTVRSFRESVERNNENNEHHSVFGMENWIQCIYLICIRDYRSCGFNFFFFCWERRLKEMYSRARAQALATMFIVVQYSIFFLYFFPLNPNLRLNGSYFVCHFSVIVVVRHCQISMEFSNDRCFQWILFTTNWKNASECIDFVDEGWVRDF